MPRIDVNRHELRAAYQSHAQIAVTEDAHGTAHSRQLCLVYAIECKIVLEILRDRSLTHTSRIEDLPAPPHSLAAGLTMLRAPAHITVGPAISSQGRALGDHELHSAFRYGLTINEPQRLISQLHAVLEWLKERNP